MPIQCEIISQDSIVFQGEADIVMVPGVDGVMGILTNHAPILSVLGYGVVSVRKGDREDLFTVSGGVVEVQPDQVTVLADAAENVEEIDFQRAQEAKNRAESLLETGVKDDVDQYRSILAALRRSQLRLYAAKRYRQRSGGPKKSTK